MAQPLTDAIEALTTYANTVTGKTPPDTTLSDAVATLASGYGGGGSGMMLIDTLTVTENTRTFNIDLTPYADYDMLVITEDLELTESDWLYYSPNASTPTGGTYNQGSRLIHQGVAMFRFIIGGFTGGQSFGKIASGTFGTFDAARTADITNVLVYTYVATKYIKAGSTFKVYAGKYSELK